MDLLYDRTIRLLTMVCWTSFVALTLAASAFCSPPTDDEPWIIHEDGVLYSVDIKYYGAEYDSGSASWQADWYDDKKCFLNINDDFTENPDWQGDPSQQWSDSGIRPPNNDDTIAQDPRYPIGRRLRIDTNDDRLCRVKVRVTSDDLQVGRFFFSTSNNSLSSQDPQTSYKVIVYDENGEIGPVVETLDQIDEYSICIETNKDYFFYLEGLNHPTPAGPTQLRHTRVFARFLPKDNKTPIHPESKIIDHVNVLVDKVDVVIRPTNYFDEQGNVEAVQEYLNEFIETGLWGGGWTRVNNDFSKEQLFEDSTGKTQGIPDNQLSGVGNYDHNEKCKLGGKFFLPNNVPGKIKIKFDEGGIVLWEIPVDGDTTHGGQHIPHNSAFEFDLPSDFLTEFEIEALRETGIGSGKLKIEYYPDSTGPDGLRMGVNVTPGPAQDKAAYTAQEQNLQVDGDRDGKFDKAQIRDENLLFWWNDDRENHHPSGAQKDQDQPSSQAIDCKDLRAVVRNHFGDWKEQSRDVEDFTGVRLNIGSFLASIHVDNPGQSIPNVEYAETHLLEPQSSSNWHYFNLFNIDASENAKSHIDEKSTIASLVACNLAGGFELYKKRVTPLQSTYTPFDDGQTAILDWDQALKTRLFDVSTANNLVMEARFDHFNTDLDTELTAKTIVHNPTGSRYEMCNPVELKIKLISKFYDIFQIGEGSVEQNALKFLHPSVTSYDPVSKLYVKQKAKVHNLEEFFALPEEQYVMFVHGWNNNHTDKRLAMETFTKRLYWQGYQGRVGAFSWPALVPADDGIGNSEVVNRTFNPSEFNAFRSSLCLTTVLATMNSDCRYYLDSDTTKYSFNEKMNLFAHSQGNIVASESLRMWAANDTDYPRAWPESVAYNRSNHEKLVDSLLTVNAALPAGMYGVDSEPAHMLVNPQIVKNLDTFSNTPDDQLEAPANAGRFEQLKARFLLAVKRRWIDISSRSDFYRYFAAGLPREDRPESATYGYDHYFADGSNYAGNVPFMKGAGIAVDQIYNYYLPNDYAVSVGWESNLAIKGLLATHGAWPHGVYSSRLGSDADNSNGKWVFSRNTKPPILNDIDEVLGGFLREEYPVVDLFKLIFRYSLDDFDAAERALFETGGTHLDLGNAEENGSQIEPGANMYEVIAFLSRCNSKALGTRNSMGHLPEFNFLDRNEFELGNKKDSSVRDHCTVGGSTAVNHSYFYYHDCECTKKFFRQFICDFEKQTGVESSYGHGCVINDSPDNEEDEDDNDTDR